LRYGDEGKGTTVDYLTKEHNASLIVRFNGGPQAAHFVVRDDGVCASLYKIKKEKEEKTKREKEKVKK
jgi:adenylosuccinate synthase